MRIVFCGSGEVAVPTMEALCLAGHEIRAVYTQPPRQAGRGGKLTSTPVDQRASVMGLLVVQALNINAPEHLEVMRQADPQLIVVVDFGQKVGQAVRDIAPLGAFNMHASLLPGLRGAAPINWAIIRGLPATGVTTFALVDKMDAGPVYLQESLAIDPLETAEELRHRLARLGAEVVLKTVAGLEAGTLAAKEQDHSQATIAPKLKKDDGILNFAEAGQALANRIRGTWPWPGAHADFVHEGRPPVRVIFARARALPMAGPNPAEPGTLADDLAVNVSDGRLEVLELKVAGKRLMHWKDFVNGYRLAKGDRFVTCTEG